MIVPLSSETSSDQWVPAVILHAAEVEKDVWQDRLAVVCDGNVGNSQQSMKHRTEADGQNLRHQVLGKLYLDLWRARWTKGNDKARFLDEKANIRKTTEIHLDDTHSKIFANPGGRGRKRRSVLRRLRNGGISSVVNPSSTAFLIC